ncbi:MAG TPA: hypothetical protein VIR58_03810 [Acidimicrobiales bacterium]
MTSTVLKSGDLSRARRRWLLLSGLVLAPVAWAIHLGAAAALVPLACERGEELWLHLTTVVALPLALTGLVCARRLARTFADEPGNELLGTLATALAALSVALIVVEQLVMFPLGPCG